MKITISQIIRSHRRSIALIITPDARLIIRAPFRTSLSDIEALVEHKKDWIINKIHLVETKMEKHQLRPFLDGELFLFMGEKYPLMLTSRDRSITSKNGKLVFPERFLKNPERALIHWYAHEALRHIPQRVEWYAEHFGLSYKGITITGAKRRWGSCSHANRLCFSWRLILMPEHVIDYVVVHELCHTIEKNHSKAFWDRVAAILPDYKTRRAALKEF